MTDTKPESISDFVRENDALKKELAEMREAGKSVDELRDTLARLNAEQEALFVKSMEDLTARKAAADAFESERDTVMASIAEERVALAKDRGDIAKERGDIAKERESLVSEKNGTSAASEEYSKVKADIEKAKGELEAREKELSESKSKSASELSTLKSLISQQETESIRLERMRDEATKATAENRAILAQIEEAHAAGRKTMDEINAARQNAEDRRIAAQAEISSASYATEMAKNMMMVFRQALNAYVQLAGQAIQIPEITDEHRRFIAKDLISQCAETPENETDEPILPQGKNDIVSEIEELASLRKQYEEKFQKKVFNGWSSEELKAKIA